MPGTVAAVARELKILLLGETPASQMARDELRWAMQEPPGRVDQITGLVTSAMRFLAGYGIYLTVSTDRAVARVLDAAMEEVEKQNTNDDTEGQGTGQTPQKLVGPYREARRKHGERFCRVGRLANFIRRGLQRMRAQNAPTEERAQANRW